jgi:multidrug resistance protein, MATE family
MAAEAEAILPAVHVSTLDLTGTRISRTILKLAWPVVVERLSISVLSAVDAGLVGHFVGADGLAAVGIGALMFWIALSGALAIDVGSTAVVARDVGAGDRSRAQLGLHTAIIAALVWGLICTTVVFAFAPVLMRLMGAQPDVAPLGVEYLRAGSLGFPMLMVLYAVSGSLRGMGNTWMPMVILVIVNLINAAVTLVLINGSVGDLGVRASGIGYATAANAGGLLALALAASGAAPVRMNAARLFEVSRASFGRLARIGLPVGLEEAQFMLAFLVYTRIVARLGTDQLAAHSLALRSLEIAILPGFALGTAATALVGQYMGAGRPDMAEAVAKRVRFFAFCALCTMAVLQFLLAPQIVRLFVDDPAVVDTGAKLLRVFAFALPAMGVHASLSGALRGAGDVRYVLGTFTFTAWGIRVPMAAFMVIGLGLTAPFAWLAAVTENWVRAALILRRFRAGKWKQLRV